MKLHTYDLDTYLFPIWKGNIIYHETVLFVGEEDEAPLLFVPTEIIQVTSYGLNRLYHNGEDFVIQGGMIKRVKGSRIQSSCCETSPTYVLTPCKRESFDAL